MKHSLKYSPSLDIYVELVTSSLDNSNKTDNSNETLLKSLIDSTCNIILQNPYLFTQSSLKELIHESITPSIQFDESSGTPQQIEYTEWERKLCAQAFQDPIKHTYYPGTLNELLDPLNGFSLNRISQLEPLEPLSFPFTIQLIHPSSSNQNQSSNVVDNNNTTSTATKPNC